MQTFGKRLSLSEYQAGILNGNRFVLSRAITLIESNLASDQALAADLMQSLLPYSGNSLRLGITGAPGVGKSTFIEAFGCQLIESGQKIAVLTIDPSSPKSGGSIMGDKTRMEQLAKNPNAYIRPSANGKTLGGVASKTRQVVSLCEAAGYQIIIIETVGVGQSEIAVKSMVDCFLLLALAGGGDELQGIKKGIMEMVDCMVITKADGNNLEKARLAAMQYQNALHLFLHPLKDWSPNVLVCSAIEKQGLQAIQEQINAFIKHSKSSGYFEKNRKTQRLTWLYESLKEQLLQAFFEQANIKNALPEIEKAVQNEEIPAHVAAMNLIALFNKKG